MGSDPEARLAYGYDLGSNEDWWLAEATEECGGLALDWYDDESSDGFETQLINRLYALIPDAPATEYDFQREEPVVQHWGVALTSAGTYESSSHILCATDPDRDFLPGYRSVEWSDTMTLDLDDMAATPARHGWDAKLTAVLAALGITPVRPDPEGDGPRHGRPKVPVGPRWLVFPFYG